MKRSKSIPPWAWSYAAQIFVGLFFLSAGYLKATRGLFGEHRHSIQEIFEYWLRIGWPAEAFRPFLQWGIGHGDAIAVAMITGQVVLGLMLILHVRPRIAGWLLIAVHIPIFLATYHQYLLYTIIFQTIWIGAFFALQPTLSGRRWTVMTYALVLIGLLHLWFRASVFGDPWISSVGWQREHFATDVMSSAVWIKTFFLWISAGSVSALLWAGSWWLKTALTLGMLTKYRLQAGLMWLVWLILLTIIWMSEWTCEGVMYVLSIFVWVTQEYQLQYVKKEHPKSLLP